MKFLAALKDGLKRFTLTKRFDSGEYWERRYRGGGNSGSGSYGRLAEYKAEILNEFVESRNITRVVELGCGDGNQLMLAKFAEYVGFDVSESALETCRKRFVGRPYQFNKFSPFKVKEICEEFRPQLAISLDVIYHLVEENVFIEYMNSLFSTGSRYVIIYSSNGNFTDTATHVVNRQFVDWTEANKPEWKMVEHRPQRYPYDPTRPHETSFSDFFIYELNESANRTSSNP